MRLFPASAGNRSVSVLPAFIRLLPAETRAWLAGLAQNTRILGFHLLPGFPEADSALLPMLEGTGVSCYVADKGEGLIGAVSVFPLAKTNLAEDVLAALPGTFRKHKGTSVLAYRPGIDRSKGETVGISETLEAIALTLDAEGVEAAVSNGTLVVTRGHRGFINRWLENMDNASWKTSLSALSFHLPKPEGDEVYLGGGDFEPSSVFPRIIAFVPEAATLHQRAPHPGGGLCWRMTRSEEAVSFDFALTGSELAAILAMEDFQRRSMQDFFAQLVLRRSQQGQERERRKDVQKVAAPPPPETPDEELPELPELPMP